MKEIYNFSAGPSMLPKEVMIVAKQNFRNWNNLGVSIIEISHRSKEFIQMTITAEKNLREILLIPSNYKVLFCHGGARGQFSAVPMNLLKGTEKPDYINTGYWSLCAAKEAEKYCFPNVINVKKIKNKKNSVLPMKDWKYTYNSPYLHYCPNETIEGIAVSEEPSFKNKIVVGDFSSTILSSTINISKYGIIYAGAQKNIGPSGITLIIIRDDLLNFSKKIVPSILDYRTTCKHNSMFNTPSTFSWYLSALVFKWIKQQGGIKVIEEQNKIKATLLYNTIDSTDFYINNVNKKNRSTMNIPFNIIDPKLTKLFLEESNKLGLIYLKNHFLLGGLRASIYNSMPIEGVKKLTRFMLQFEKKYG